MSVGLTFSTRQTVMVQRKQTPVWSIFSIDIRQMASLHSH